jgi:hypothetical protein
MKRKTHFQLFWCKVCIFIEQFPKYCGLEYQQLHGRSQRHLEEGQ